MLYELVFGGSWVQTCLIGLLTTLLVYWIIQKRKYKLPPGPFALPLLGNALQLDKFIHKKIFNEWSKKYGPVVTVRFGPVMTIFVNNYETAMEVLVKKSTDFAGRYHMPSMEVLTDNGKDIAFGQYSPMWKLQRKVAISALRRYMQGSALENRVHEALETGFKELEKEKGLFDPKEYIHFIIGNILVGLCFGGKHEFKDAELGRIIQLEDELIKAFEYGTLEDFIPGLRYVYKSQAMKEVESLGRELLDDYMKRKFYEEEKTYDKDNIRHFTDCLLSARTENKDEDGTELLTDTHLIQTLSDIFFAGIDTSRISLRFAIIQMMAFPDIQAKVQEEIDRVVGHDRLPGMTDRAELSYTEAVLHESMRYSSVLPIGVPHMALCDSEINGHQIPKGTQVIINQWGLHHDPELWDEPDRFIPERYLDENGRMGPKPKGWLPFSAGKRVCLGEFVAKPELHLIFAALMQRFEWRCQSGYIPDLTPDGSSFTVVPKDCKAIITKRIP